MATYRATDGISGRPGDFCTIALCKGQFQLKGNPVGHHGLSLRLFFVNFILRVLGPLFFDDSQNVIFCHAVVSIFIDPAFEATHAFSFSILDFRFSITFFFNSYHPIIGNPF